MAIQTQETSNNVKILTVQYKVYFLISIFNYGKLWQNTLNSYHFKCAV